MEDGAGRITRVTEDDHLGARTGGGLEPVEIEVDRIGVLEQRCQCGS